MEEGSIGAQIYACLSAGQEDDGLKQLERNPGFLIELMRFIGNSSGREDDLRFNAAVFLKNLIKRRWEYVPSREKTFLRNELIRLITEPVMKIAVQLAITISKIAEVDGRDNWPELLPALSKAVKSKENVTQQRGLLFLGFTVRARGCINHMEVRGLMDYISRLIRSQNEQITQSPPAEFLDQFFLTAETMKDLIFSLREDSDKIKEADRFVADFRNQENLVEYLANQTSPEEIEKFLDQRLDVLHF